MAPRRPGYRGDYDRLRSRLLAGGRRCAYCSNDATEADHVPPLALHTHTGRGRCRLVPSCAPCARRQGGLLRGAQFAAEQPVDDDAQLVEPVGFDVLSPVWDVPWLDDLRDVPASAVWPRLMTVPHPRAVGSLGEEFETWTRADFGVELRWFQRLAARRFLEVDADGVLVWLVLLLTLARQLGKSTVLASFLGWRLVEGLARFGEEQLLLHTARVADVARDVQRPARTWARGRPDEMKVIEANGKEMIEHFVSGSRWLVRAENAAYGLSSTTALVDEGWDIKEATVDEGIEPSLVAHEQPQLLLTSTAHRLATKLMLARRASALASLDDPDDELIIEWSAPRGVDINDRTAWRLASPYWDDRREKLIAKKVAKALAGEVIDPTEPDPVEAVRTQWLNIWPAAAGGRRGEPLVDLDAWRVLADADATPVGTLSVAVDDWFGLGAAAAVAGVTADDRVNVGGWLFESRSQAFEWADSWLRRVPGSSLLVGASLGGDPALDDLAAAEVDTRGSADARTALPLLRHLVRHDLVVHDGGADIVKEIPAARVAISASGGLRLLHEGRGDLVRCVAWVVEDAHRAAGLDPQVFGASGVASSNQTASGPSEPEEA